MMTATPEWFPIQNGPAVPWHVMAPHESTCQRNHGQSLTRLAERGGLSPYEAWCVVNDKTFREMGDDKADFEKGIRRWKAFASRVNRHYAELQVRVVELGRQLGNEKAAHAATAAKFMKAMGLILRAHQEAVDILKGVS